MSDAQYLEAQKLGKKEQKNCMAQGRNPFLPVLDEILVGQEGVSDMPLGVQSIPLDHVVGTSTRGRTQAFAANFMPILDIASEFAYKWSTLADAQVNEGIRDPIICYEYMNRYYVVEGNKRVSVLKYFKADSIVAKVTRKVPKLTDDVDVQVYYEYMHFYDVTEKNDLYFSIPGKAERLLNLVGQTTKWDKELRQEFSSVSNRFTKAYIDRGGRKLPITIGDALVAFLSVYGYDKARQMSLEDFIRNVANCWDEFVVLAKDDKVDLILSPQEAPAKRGFLNYFLPSNSKKFTVAFLYPKTPEESDWTYAHDLGRSYIEELFGDQIKVICVHSVSKDDVEAVLHQVIAQGAKIIFEISPQMLQNSLKVAIEHPEVTILNCSLDKPHKYICTYYSRMYEAKFLSGMIAGAMADNDKIAYVADYPVYGMMANINAFALGALCVNPRAKVYLEWSTTKGFDLDKFLTENDIRYVSNQDFITPLQKNRHFGLYAYENKEAKNLVMPYWNWGVFYEKIIQSILSGVYQNTEDGVSKALNYWWGMSAGVIDIVYSNHIPDGIKRLMEYMRFNIINGNVNPFYGNIYDQEGKLRHSEDKGMAAEDIMRLDYFVNNVIGRIPDLEEFTDQARPFVISMGEEDRG